jgi:hypothetical protein
LASFSGKIAAALCTNAKFTAVSSVASGEKEKIAADIASASNRR